MNFVPPHRKGLAALFSLYVIWSSTYLALSIAVGEDGFSPFFMVALRTAAAGALLLAFAALRKEAVRPGLADFVILVPAGLLLWLGGNGLITWSLQRIDSGYAALSVGTLPLWTTLIDSIADHRRPSPGLILSLLLGFSGLLILNGSTLSRVPPQDIGRVIALFCAPVFWSLGSVLQARRPVAVSSIASAGWQQLIASVGFLVATAIFETPVLPDGRGPWIAFVYVTVFGGLVAFTAYIFCLQVLSPTLAVSYAFVNPVIAVFLGWFFLDETVHGSTFVSAALIFAGVAGIIRFRRPKSAPPDSESR